MRELLRQLIDALEQGEERIFCQVVETRGSTPQKASAVMIVDPLGGQIGTLGGGCVEAEVKLKAMRRLGQPGAESFSFLLDHDYAWADGLICGGKMVILAEALQGSETLAYLRALSDLLEAGRGLTEAVVIDPTKAGGTLGARYLFDEFGRIVAGRPDAIPPASVSARVTPIAERPRCSAVGGVATLPELPRVRLIVVGAGHVGQAVADLAARADFDVIVVDDRAQYANAERFPTARALHVGAIEDVLSSLDYDAHTFALIVTRGHGHDQEALYHLAPTSCAYVGLIGSRRKIRLIFEELRNLGMSEATLARVAAPVGVEIGSQSVPEIAVSIVAELIAFRNTGSLPSSSSSRLRPVVLSEPTPRAECEAAS